MKIGVTLLLLFPVLYASSQNVGIGTTSPLTKLSSTDLNIVGGDGTGVGPGSLTWSINSSGYAGAFYNQSTAFNAYGLAVKVAGSSPSQRILELSTGVVQNQPGAPVFTVLGNGNTGIGVSNPQQKLEVDGNITGTGNITAAGNFDIGIEYLSITSVINPFTIDFVTCNCPPGKKVIGGGGGFYGQNGFLARDVITHVSSPTPGGAGWTLLIANTHATETRPVIVWAICARVQ